MGAPPTTIRSIETMLLDVPTIREHKLAMTVMRSQTVCLVKITCHDGIVGWGEATTIGGLSYGPESPESIKLNIDTYFAPLLIGSAADPATATALLASNIVGNNFAKCAIETALFDAEGKRQGVPVSDLLGTRQQESLPVLWALASGDTQKDIAEAVTMLELKRHNAFKLKIGRRELEEDVAHVAAIKQAVGDAASIRVDVNMAWDEATAMRALPMLADAGCDLIEQPIDRHNVAGMARLRAQDTIAIMADEALIGPHSAHALAEANAADVFTLKIEQSGGLLAAREVAQIARENAISLYGGTMLEAGIGTAAAAHLFATMPQLEWGTELFSPLLLTEEILAEPLVYEDFALRVPTGPGLGVEIDEMAIASFMRGAEPRLVFAC